METAHSTFVSDEGYYENLKKGPISAKINVRVTF